MIIDKEKYKKIKNQDSNTIKDLLIEIFVEKQEPKIENLEEKHKYAIENIILILKGVRDENDFKNLKYLNEKINPDEKEELDNYSKDDD